MFALRNQNNMKTKYYSLLLLLPLLASCVHPKKDAENIVTNTGRIIGAGASQFVGGVGEGIDKTFQCTIQLSDSLKLKGLKTGKYAVSDSILTVYFVFDRDFNKTIKVKVTDKNGQEYGRTSLFVTAKKDSAQFFDFKFDKRTQIESKSTFSME
jgi:hypothetical protein